MFNEKIGVRSLAKFYIFFHRKIIVSIHVLYKKLSVYFSAVDTVLKLGGTEFGNEGSRGGAPGGGLGGQSPPKWGSGGAAPRKFFREIGPQKWSKMSFWRRENNY